MAVPHIRGITLLLLLYDSPSPRPHVTSTTVIKTKLSAFSGPLLSNLDHHRSSVASLCSANRSGFSRGYGRLRRLKIRIISSFSALFDSREPRRSAYLWRGTPFYLFTSWRHYRTADELKIFTFIFSIVNIGGFDSIKTEWSDDVNKDWTEDSGDGRVLNSPIEILPFLLFLRRWSRWRMVEVRRKLLVIYKLRIFFPKKIYLAPPP